MSEELIPLDVVALQSVLVDSFDKNPECAQSVLWNNEKYFPIEHIGTIMEIIPQLTDNILLTAALSSLRRTLDGHSQNPDFIKKLESDFLEALLQIILALYSNSDKRVTSMATECTVLVCFFIKEELTTSLFSAIFKGIQSSEVNTKICSLELVNEISKKCYPNRQDLFNPFVRLVPEFLDEEGTTPEILIAVLKMFNNMYHRRLDFVASTDFHNALFEKLHNFLFKLTDNFEMFSTINSLILTIVQFAYGYDFLNFEHVYNMMLAEISIEGAPEHYLGSTLETVTTIIKKETEFHIEACRNNEYQEMLNKFFSGKKAELLSYPYTKYNESADYSLSFTNVDFLRPLFDILLRADFNPLLDDSPYEKVYTLINLLKEVNSESVLETAKEFIEAHQGHSEIGDAACVRLRGELADIDLELIDYDYIYSMLEIESEPIRINVIITLRKCHPISDLGFDTYMEVMGMDHPPSATEKLYQMLTEVFKSKNYPRKEIFKQWNQMAKLFFIFVESEFFVDYSKAFIEFLEKVLGRSGDLADVITAADNDDVKAFMDAIVDKACEYNAMDDHSGDVYRDSILYFLYRAVQRVGSSIIPVEFEHMSEQLFGLVESSNSDIAIQTFCAVCIESMNSCRIRFERLFELVSKYMQSENNEMIANAFMLIGLFFAQYFDKANASVDLIMETIDDLIKDNAYQASRLAPVIISTAKFLLNRYRGQVTKKRTKRYLDYKPIKLSERKAVIIGDVLEKNNKARKKEKMRTENVLPERVRDCIYSALTTILGMYNFNDDPEINDEANELLYLGICCLSSLVESRMSDKEDFLWKNRMKLFSIGESILRIDKIYPDTLFEYIQFIDKCISSFPNKMKLTITRRQNIKILLLGMIDSCEAISERAKEVMLKLYSPI